MAQSGPWTGVGFDGLTPGNYLFTLFDGDSTCSAVSNFSILAAPDIALFAVASSPFCSGGDDGSISALVADTFDVSGYTLDGEPVDVNGNFSGLSAGTYFVEVQAVGPSGATCADTATVTVVDPPGMTITLESVEGADPNQENGEVEISVTGGVEPYSFEWTGPTGTSGFEDPDDLGAGEWTLIVTDDDGCSASLVVSIPVGILEWSGTRFTLWPNPTRNAFEIRFESNFQGEVLLTDLTGRLLERNGIQGMTYSGTLVSWPAGVYLLRAEDTSGRGSTVRIVKQD